MPFKSIGQPYNRVNLCKPSRKRATLSVSSLRGWLKPGIFAPLAYAASPINGDAQIFKKHANDLKGKTVIPFTTHEGSGLAKCVEDVKDAFPGANVTKGFSIYGHEVRTEKKKVEKWLNSLGY